MTMTSTAVFREEILFFDPVTPDGDALPIVFAFPNTYSVGITSLGYQVVWSTFARRSDVAVSRLFTDVHEHLPSRPAVLGFSFSWELDYGHILDLLEQLHLPIHSEKRQTGDPIVFGGGPVLTANPEPFAAFFDVILLGDGEHLLDAFTDALIACRHWDRPRQLRHLAQVPGVYVPSLYRVTYSAPDGPIAAIEPVEGEVPAFVEKQTYRGDRLSVSTVVTPQAAWENIYMVEVVRSCPEMCRFCLASYLTLPFRTADLGDGLIPAIDRGLQQTHRLGLLGASVTQHPQFGELLAHLAQPKYADVRLSIASVRTNTVTAELAQLLAQRDTKSLTIAIESGSPRLRQIINKKLEDEAIYAAAANAQKGGLKSLKFYGMVGLPGETLEDLDLTVALFKQLKKESPKLRYTLGCSTFVPKAHTPFQWEGVNPEAQKRLQLLQKQLRPLGVDFRPESYNWSVIQALLSRGDRRLTALLEKTRHYGDTLGSYKRAFKELRGQLPPLEDYVHAPWGEDRLLPWQHLHGPLPLGTLQKHRQQSLAPQ